MRHALLVAAVLVPAALPAQVRTASQAHAWAGLLGDYAITDRVALYQEVWLRRAEEGATWQQRHFAQGATLTLHPRWRVTAGHTYVRSLQYGELPAARETDEHRAWTHVTFTHATGPLRWTHRTRAEWRWIQASPEWTRTARVRQQVRAVLPVGEKTYLAAQGESFVRLHPAAQRGDLEQTRAWASVGRTIAPRTNLELSYLGQRLRRATERERNHTLVVNLRATWRLR
jgi:hypothetical protein